MWLVMEHEIINLNQVSSISIVRGGVDEGEEWQMVCLRYAARAPSYKSDESDLPLFVGSLERCEVFLREFKKEMVDNRVFFLNNITQDVERTSNVR